MLRGRDQGRQIAQCAKGAADACPRRLLADTERARDFGITAFLEDPEPQRVALLVAEPFETARQLVAYPLEACELLDALVLI